MEALSGEPAVTGQLAQGAAGIWHRRAPASAQSPHLIFHRVSSHDLPETFGGARWEDQLWLVKGVARDGDDDAVSAASVVEDLSTAIDELLHDAALPVTAHVVLWLRRESRVEYDEPDGHERWLHAGGIYRLKLEPDA